MGAPRRTVQGAYVCSIHGKKRGEKNVEDDGAGGWKCMAGEECIVDSSGLGGKGSGAEWSSKQSSSGAPFNTLGGPRDAKRPKLELAKPPDTKPDTSRWDDFFDSLPDDDFLPEEDALRDALLAFLDVWPNELPPRFTEDSNSAMDDSGEPDIIIQMTKEALLPLDLPLHLWCENRMGEELDLLHTPGGTFFHRTGVVDDNAVHTYLRSQP